MPPAAMCLRRAGGGASPHPSRGRPPCMRSPVLGGLLETGPNACGKTRGSRPPADHQPGQPCKTPARVLRWPAVTTLRAYSPLVGLANASGISKVIAMIGSASSILSSCGGFRSSPYGFLSRKTATSAVRFGRQVTSSFPVRNTSRSTTQPRFLAKASKSVIVRKCRFGESYHS